MILNKALIFFQIAGVVSFTTMHGHRNKQYSGRKHLPSFFSTPSGFDEDDFYRDLETAKREKLGAPFPLSEDEQVEVAENAETDFLTAMKQVKKEFAKAKEDMGVDGAIDMFKDQWDEEDRLEDADEDDMIGEFE